MVAIETDKFTEYSACQAAMAKW